MEHPVASPFEGVVKAVRVDPATESQEGWCSSSRGMRGALRGRAVGDPASAQVYQPNDNHDPDVEVQKPLIEKSGAIHSASPTIAILMQR